MTSLLGTVLETYGGHVLQSNNKVPEPQEPSEHTRDAQIHAIESSFEVAASLARTIAHPTKKNVVSAEIIPIYPDFDMWRYKFHPMQFDSEPTAQALFNDLTTEELKDQLCHAVLRGETNLAVFYLPTSESFKKRKRRGLFPFVVRQ